MNSEGCSRKPPIVSHLVAPFTSGPMTNVAAIRPQTIISPKRHNARMVRGPRIDVINIIRLAGIKNIMCFQTKCCSGRPMRLATGGLAAMTRTAPKTISRKMLASIILSTVHHHMPMRDLSVLSNMIRHPLARRV